VRDVFCNTSPLQYLHQAGVLHLLSDLYGRVVVPEAVVAELHEGRARSIALPEINGLSWVEVRGVQDRRLLPMVADLGPGEREVIALGLESPGSLLLLDDRMARRYATYLKLPVAGTLAVLLKAKQTGALAKLAPVVEQLEALGFRLDARTRRAVLELSDEQG
jgi:hypothetical protein